MNTFHSEEGRRACRQAGDAIDALDSGSVLLPSGAGNNRLRTLYDILIPHIKHIPTVSKFSSPYVDDISKALESHIDEFALNIGWQEEMDDVGLQSMFQAAQVAISKLKFSFDYTTKPGPWDKDDIVSLINQYKKSKAYFWHHVKQPLLSTFEGPDQTEDWHYIKDQTGAIFVPSWSSKGRTVNPEKSSWRIRETVVNMTDILLPILPERRPTWILRTAKVSSPAGFQLVIIKGQVLFRNFSVREEMAALIMGN